MGNYPKIGANVQAPSLRTALARLEVGRIPPEEFRRILEENIREVIREQVEAGVELITDGQLGWEDGQTPFARQMEGFSINGLIRYFDTNTYYRQPVAEGPLRRKGPVVVEAWRFAQAHSPVPVKAVITGPYTLARLSQDRHFGDLRKFTLALAEILNQEALEVQQAGAPFIQFDEPAILKHPEDLPLLEEASRVLTRGLTVKTALYTWFGSIRGLYPDLFRLPFQVFGLDFVMGRENFDLLQDFPSDRELGFGIVDARNTKMETVEQIVSALDRIRRVVPLDRLYVNPSCGLEYLPRERAREKLARMVEGVRKAREVLV